MRWYWIDRFIEFHSGKSAKAIKNVSLAEDHLHDHFPYYPMIPNSLVIEGMAQTGGLLICEHGHFQEKVVLAKIPKAVFHCEATPGDTLVYSAKIEYIREEGAMDVRENKLDPYPSNLAQNGKNFSTQLDLPRNLQAKTAIWNRANFSKTLYGSGSSGLGCYGYEHEPNSLTA